MASYPMSRRAVAGPITWPAALHPLGLSFTCGVMLNAKLPRLLIHPVVGSYTYCGGAACALCDRSVIRYHATAICLFREVSEQPTTHWLIDSDYFRFAEYASRVAGMRGLYVRLFPSTLFHAWALDLIGLQVFPPNFTLPPGPTFNHGSVLYRPGF